MRDYKFRGKNIKGNWEYGNLVISDHNRLYEIIDKERRYRGELNKETIGQYTGLKDKNGKEIYEGDIVYIIPEDEKGIVKWDKETVGYIVEYCDIITNFDNWYGKDLEVIGNIYDNPELLEEGE